MEAIAKHCYLEKKQNMSYCYQLSCHKIPYHMKFTNLDKTPNTTLDTIPITPPNTPSKATLQPHNK